MASRALGYLDEDTQECIDLMDGVKEKGLINLMMNCAPLSEDWMSQTLIAPSVSYISGRQYLQNFGNGARTVFGDTFWIDMVLPNPTLHEGWGCPNDLLIDFYPEADAVIVTDVRYPNEAERINALGGVVIEVVRPCLSSDGHASEMPLPRPLVKYTIQNSGSLDDLSAAVDVAMSELGICA